MRNYSGKNAGRKHSAVKPVKTKKPQTILMKSVIILLSFLAAEGVLALALHFAAQLTQRFDWVVDKLEWVEKTILSFMSAKNVVFVILLMFFIYFIKSYIPFLPLSIVCLMTGSLFGRYWWAALIINMAGLALMFFLRFNSGRVKGENYMQNLLRKSKYVRMAIDVNGVSSYSLLAAFRFFPCFPINFVSRLYGANKDCKFQWYMLISIAAIAPRTYVYTRIGRELFNPFSKVFITLLMILVAFSGLGVFITNMVFYFRRRKEDINSAAAMEKMRYVGEDEFEEEAEPEVDYGEEKSFTDEVSEMESRDEQDDIAEMKEHFKNKFNG